MTNCCYFAWDGDEPKDGVSAKCTVPGGYLLQANLTAPTPKSTKRKLNSQVAPASSTPTDKSTQNTPDAKKKESSNCFCGLLSSRKMKNKQACKKSKENSELSALPVNRQSVLARLKGKLGPDDIPSSVPVRDSTNTGLDTVQPRISYSRSTPPATSSQPPAPSQSHTSTNLKEPAPPIGFSTGSSPCTFQMRLDNPNAGIVVLQKVSQPITCQTPILSCRPDMVYGNMKMVNHPSDVMVTEVNPVRRVQQGEYVPHAQPAYQCTNHDYPTAAIMVRPQVQVLPEAIGFPSQSHQTQGFMIPIQRFVVPRAGVDSIHPTSQGPLIITRDCQQCMDQNGSTLNVPFK